MRQNKFLISASICASLLVTGCVDQFSFSKSSSDLSQIAPPLKIPIPSPSDNPSPSPTETVTPGTVSFTEPDLTNRKLDVLFVIHATGSFNGQIAKGASQGLANFINALTTGTNAINGLDYQVATMLAYPGTPNSSSMSAISSQGTLSTGNLFSSNLNGAGGPVLSSETLGITAIQTALSNDFQRAPTANYTYNLNDGTQYTGHGEFGTLALLNALQHVQAVRSSSGFFRPGAALAIIFLANESDNCFIGNDDGDQDEVAAKKAICHYAAQDVVDAIQNVQGSNPYLVGFIGYMTDPLQNGQTVDEHEAGNGYIDVAQLASNQAFVNLDPGSVYISDANQQSQMVASGLTNVGNIAKSQFQIQTSFAIAAPPAGARIQITQVTVNGGSPIPPGVNGWTYDAASSSVSIASSYLSSKASVQISYNVIQ